MSMIKKGKINFVKCIKRNDNGVIKITKKTIDNKIIFDFLNGCTELNDNITVLKAIITDCKNNDINYTLSDYCIGLLAADLLVLE